MRHAIITAGTKGLGKITSEYLLAEGYSITVTYRSGIQTVEKLRHEWKDHLNNIQFIQADVTKKEDIINLVSIVLERFSRIDALILNAGPYIFMRKKLVDYKEEEWNQMVEGNLTSAFHFFKLVIPIMRKQLYGRIITYGFQEADHSPGWLYRSAFAASKVGLVSLTKTLSIEEAEFGITANMVCPGKIIGEMKETTIEESRKIANEETPVGRSGTGEDIARTVLFLCDEKSDMITGSVLEVTGGIDVLHRYR